MTRPNLHRSWHRNPKVAGLTLAAQGLWARALSWCNDNETDGRIPPRVPKRSWGASLRLIAELVDAQLWDVHADGGWSIHGYLEHNDSKADLERRRSEWKDRQRRYRGGFVQKRMSDSVTVSRGDKRQDNSRLKISCCSSSSSDLSLPEIKKRETTTTQTRARVAPDRPPAPPPPDSKGQQMALWADTLLAVTGIHWEVGQHRQHYEYLASRPANEQQAVLEQLRTNPWFREYGHFASPKRIRERFDVLARFKPLAKASSSPRAAERVDQLSKAKEEFRAARAALQAPEPGMDRWAAEQRVERARQEVYRLERIVQQQQAVAS